MEKSGAGEKLIVGVDLGGTNLKCGLVNEEGRVLHRAALPSLPARGAEPVLADMAALIEAAIKSVGASHDEVIGVGIGAPGPLSHRDGVIYKAANLPGWENVRVRRGIIERVGLPATLENDANAAAFGEFWVGAARGVCNTVALTLGTGVGAGVILEGELLRGHFENAAELGHMIVQPNGLACSCGQSGCLEQYASPGGISRRAGDEIAAGAKSSLADELTRRPSLSGKLVAEAAQAGDALAKRLWDEACRYLAIGCINVQHAFNPERIVLAGGMSRSGDALLDPLRKHVAALKWQLYDDVPDIVIGGLGDDAGVIGAAGCAFKCYKDGKW